MTQGKVNFPRNRSWTPGLIEELLRFPAGINDDQVDVLSLIGRSLPQLQKGEPPSQATLERAPGTITMDDLLAEARRQRPSRRI